MTATMFRALLLLGSLLALPKQAQPKQDRPLPTSGVHATAALRLVDDSITITNSHPHPMTIALERDSTSVALGTVQGESSATLAIKIPLGAHELRLKASFALMEGMEERTTLSIKAGQPLKWSF